MEKRDTDFQRTLYKLMVSWLEFAVTLLRSSFCPVHACHKGRKKALKINGYPKFKEWWSWRCGRQLVPSWMPWAKGLPMHTDGSPAEKPYKAFTANEKKQDKVLFSRTYALAQTSTHPGKLQNPHMAPQAWSEISIYGFLEMALG